ncbi:hypothetical protein, partial [Mycobacterium marinum]
LTSRLINNAGALGVAPRGSTVTPKITGGWLEIPQPGEMPDCSNTARKKLHRLTRVAPVIIGDQRRPTGRR